jgi:hypothetical protein
MRKIKAGILFIRRQTDVQVITVGSSRYRSAGCNASHPWKQSRLGRVRQN